jgi:hypothetical protein
MAKYTANDKLKLPEIPAADWVWNVYDGVDSFTSFCEIIAKPFILPSTLPEKLQEEFGVVHKLLQHAYFEYRFIDIALLQTAVLFEKVLKSYYQETEGKVYNGNLKQLINHFVSKNHFEFSNAHDILHVHRDIRNRKVHDIDAPNGLLMIRGVYRLISFINELYEDQNLRKHRKEETAQLQSILDRLIAGGASLEIEKGSYVLLYDATVLFLNNKKMPSEITIAFWPEFNLQPYQDGLHHYQISPLIKKVYLPEQVDENILELSLSSDQKLTINGVLDEPLKWMSEAWFKQANSLPNLQTVMQVKNSFLNDEMEKVMNDFYSATT